MCTDQLTVKFRDILLTDSIVFLRADAGIDPIDWRISFKHGIDILSRIKNGCLTFLAQSKLARIAGNIYQSVAS